MAKIGCKRNNITVISDEIYAELDFSGKYKSLTHYYPEGVIISSGISKWCGAGGWRLGTFIFPQELNLIKKTIRSVASETFSSVSAPIQYAAIKAYNNNFDNFLKNSRKILSIIATYIYNELTNVGLACQKPEGGFYMLCDFSEVTALSNEISNSSSLCKKILKDIGLAMLPGSDFGLHENQLITRIAFVDFDGQEALKNISNKFISNDDFLKKNCPKIVNGINKLKDWIKNQ